jgi:hypothetical protein
VTVLGKPCAALPLASVLGLHTNNIRSAATENALVLLSLSLSLSLSLKGSQSLATADEDLLLAVPVIQHAPAHLRSMLSPPVLELGIQAPCAAPCACKRTTASADVSPSPLVRLETTSPAR